MAGIYIHIPFCKKACHYCNFHFSTTLNLKNEIIDGIVSEISLRKNYFENELIETIYFGGGTPSILNKVDIEKIINALYKNFNIKNEIEFTLEANPDDLQKDKVQEFVSLGVNRLSIGIQSFFDEDLLYMNRTHNGSEAESCIQNAMEVGINNISIDLIFGYPLLNDEKWKQNIDKAIALKIPHLSCYAMTVEPHTALNSMIQKNKLPPLNVEQSAKQFEYLMDELNKNGYEHYEISNYALPTKRAHHNSNYWKGVSYLGLGPSAHSYNGICRQWNVANNVKYLKGIEIGIPDIELEKLTKNQMINEAIMIGLRTIEGLDISNILPQLNDSQQIEFEKSKQQFMTQDLIRINEKNITLTQQGKLFADHIASEFFIV